MLRKLFSIETGALLLAALLAGLTTLLWSSQGVAVYLDVLAAGFAACF